MSGQLDANPLLSVSLQEETAGLELTLRVRVAAAAWQRAYADHSDPTRTGSTAFEDLQTVEGRLLSAARRLLDQARPQLQADLEVAACELLEQQLKELREQSTRGS